MPETPTFTTDIRDLLGLIPKKDTNLRIIDSKLTTLNQEWQAMRSGDRRDFFNHQPAFLRAAHEALEVPCESKEMVNLLKNIDKLEAKGMSKLIAKADRTTALELARWDIREHIRHSQNVQNYEDFIDYANPVIAHCSARLVKETRDRSNFDINVEMYNVLASNITTYEPKTPGTWVRKDEGLNKTALRIYLLKFFENTAS